MDTNTNGCTNECYTASQAAKLLGLKKGAVLARCQKGQFSGAYKTDPNPAAGDPHGQWLIPRSVVDQEAGGQASAVQDVVVLRNELTPVEMERILTGIVDRAVSAAVEPLRGELAEQRELIERQHNLLASALAEPAKIETDNGGLNWVLVIIGVIVAIGVFWWLLHK